MKDLDKQFFKQLGLYIALQGSRWGCEMPDYYAAYGFIEAAYEILAPATHDHQSDTDLVVETFKLIGLEVTVTSTRRDYNLPSAPIGPLYVDGDNGSTAMFEGPHQGLAYSLGTGEWFARKDSLSNAAWMGVARTCMTGASVCFAIADGHHDPEKNVIDPDIFSQIFPNARTVGVPVHAGVPA